MNIKHYELVACPICGKLDAAVVGDHIKIASEDKVYIAPICRNCNTKTEGFYIDDQYLVPIF